MGHFIIKFTTAKLLSLSGCVWVQSPITKSKSRRHFRTGRRCYLWEVATWKTWARVVVMPGADSEQTVTYRRLNSWVGQLPSGSSWIINIDIDFGLLLVNSIKRLFVVVLCHSNSITVIYYGGDMIYEMRSRMPEPTPLPIQGIFNLPHGMIWEELAFDDAVSYSQWEMDCSTAQCYGTDGIRTPVPGGTNPVP